MREKLIEWLLQEDGLCKLDECKDCNANGSCYYYRAADRIIAHGVTVQEWISVKDRLPGEEGLYLVAVVNDHERRYSKTAWYHGRENWFSNQKVTHWMPLPEPPKGE